MNTCVEKWLSNQILAPIGLLIQSSGAGKTRYMKEFAKEHWCLSICLRREKDDGYPKRSSLASTFEIAMNNQESATRFMIAMMDELFKHIRGFLEHKKIGKYNTESSVCKELQKYQAWSDNNLLYDNIQKNYESSEQKKNETEQCLAIFNNFKTYLNREIPSIFFLIDEASTLLVKTDKRRSNDNYYNKFDCMRQAIRFVFGVLNQQPRRRVAFLLADTQSTLKECVLTSSVTSSQRTINKPIYEAFFQVFNLHICSYSEEFKDYRIKIEKFASEGCFDTNFLKERDPYTSLFYYGRPLWGSLLSQGYDNDGVLYLAKAKLICSSLQISKIEDDRYYACLAVFASLTDLLISSKSDCESKLVAKYMSTLVNIYEADESKGVKTQFSVRYLNEPILAQAANEILRDKAEFDIAIKCFHSFALNFDAKGPMGELL